MTIRMELGRNSYDIVIEDGCLARAGERLDLARRVLVVTDDGVPPAYAQKLAGQCKTGVVATVAHGEGSKSLDTLQTLLQTMLDAGFDRGDCVCAVGGGMTGDLAGFAAASYMRGVDFYNLPTTVLSQVDSSVGGKTAVNFGGVKNIVGAFWQPKAVLIDPKTLATLPPRQTASGLAEAAKMALIADRELFELFESQDVSSCMERVIEGSVRIKKSVVERDEREGGLRRALNFGHTIGHGIESATELTHGESIALGMLPMCSDAVRPRLLRVMERLGLPTEVRADRERVYQAMLHDKKSDAGALTVVRVDEAGSFRMERVEPEALRPCIEMVVKA